MVRWITSPNVGMTVLYQITASRTLPAIVLGRHSDGRLALAVLVPGLTGGQPNGTVTLDGRLAAFDENGGAGTWHWPPWGGTYTDSDG